MSKELYDLCRKYKYFYNKNKDVESWNRKYHDIDLSDTVAQTKIQLSLVENELLKQLFKDMKVNVGSIDVNNEHPISYNMTGRFGEPMFDKFTRVNATVDFFNSSRFIQLLSEYMCDFRSHNMIR